MEKTEINDKIEEIKNEKDLYSNFIIKEGVLINILYILYIYHTILIWDN